MLNLDKAKQVIGKDLFNLIGKSNEKELKELQAAAETIAKLDWSNDPANEQKNNYTLRVIYLRLEINLDFVKFGY